MDATRRTILHLYRNLLREGQLFQNYNFRQYTLRKVKDTFRQHKNETDITKLNEFIKQAEGNLELIKRQVAIGRLYNDAPVAVERR